jgi:hypothetical protein
VTDFLDDIRRFSRLALDAEAARREHMVGNPNCRRCNGHGRIILAAEGALDAVPRAPESYRPLIPGRAVETTSFAPPGSIYDVACPDCGFGLDAA